MKNQTIMQNTQSIKDKVNNWDDVLKVSGKTEDEILPYKKPSSPIQKRLNAFAKLCLITEVLNEGWYPNWESDEYKYYNWWTLRGVFCFNLCYRSWSSSTVPSALCFKSEELSKHAAKIALEEYKEFYS